MDSASLLSPKNSQSSSDASIMAAPARLTISQAVRYFAATLEKAGNYPRVVRAYLEYCLSRGYGFDRVSLQLHAAGVAASRVSPVRKFLSWYQVQGNPVITADPPKGAQSIPAANELILGFLAEADRLQGDQSKNTYTKALNGFFSYIAAQHTEGQVAGFSAATVRGYMSELKQKKRSAFTANLYLSAIKQLANWVVKTRDKHGLTITQVEQLRDISTIRGRRIDRGYHKDSLTADERNELLATVDDPADRAMVGLMAWGGLRTIELTRLRIQDVDLDQHKLYVLGKGKATRKDIQLPTILLPILATYLSGIDHGKKNPASLLFEGLTTRSLRYRVRKYLTATSLLRARLSAHSLRHTAAQQLLNDGVDAVHVQRHLRHEQFETTLAYVRKQTDQDYFEQIK